MWLQVVTRLDLAFVVSLLTYFAHKPGKAYQKALKHVMGYIRETIGYKII